MNKVGLGYDVHRFKKGRPLFLGGVRVPHHEGLDGHSDADVLLHAVCDALLGALGQGDIGEHFPNTDPRFKDIASRELLAEVVALVERAGYRVDHVDVVVIAEAPNLKNFKQQMRETMAAVMKTAPANVNVKATTNEGMGFVGRGEGIAAYATALLTRG